MIVAVNDVGLGVEGCSWSGPGGSSYQESNGIPGLQTQGDCEHDMPVASVFVARTGMCRL